MFLRSGPDWHLDTAGVRTMEAFLAERGTTAKDAMPIPRDLYLEYVEWFRRGSGVDPVATPIVRLDRGEHGARRFLATCAGGDTIAADSVAIAIGFRRIGLELGGGGRRLKLEPWLTPRLASPVVHTWPHTEIASVAERPDSLAVELTSGVVLEVDRVVLATGYKVEMSRVPLPPATCSATSPPATAFRFSTIGCRPACPACSSPASRRRRISGRSSDSRCRREPPRC